MKTTPLIFSVSLFFMIGCNQSGTQDNGLITVDVTKTNYPKRDLVLQDFMDVEYIALETNDEFVNQGFVQAIGKDFIIVKNYRNDGDIFIYDRSGKAIRKINRKGQAGEEYINCKNIILDDNNSEMYVNDFLAKKIQVYDLEGNYKRTLKQKIGDDSQGYADIFNFDTDNLICYYELNENIPFLIVSKQDGSITKEIKIPFSEKKVMFEILRDYENDRTLVAGPGDSRPIIPTYDGNWILSEPSSDTIYTLMPDYSLYPYLVRTPPVQTMKPEIFPVLRLMSNRYFFIETVKKEYDFESETGFPKTYLMYDTREKDFFRYTMYNGDFSYKKEVFMVALTPVDHKIESWQSLNAFELIADYKIDKLKGRLKEIAAILNEDSNPVIMLVKHKK